MTWEDRADAVYAAVKQLNRVIMDASKDGLEVRLDIVTLRAIGNPADVPHIESSVHVLIKAGRNV